MTLTRNVIARGDARTELAHIPAGSVDCIATSPPYFRLRNYQADGQLGLEAHVDDWVDSLLAVLDEAGRVLVPTGTLWLNLGDSYSTHRREGAGRKSLLLAPERLALRLVERGWLLRNKIVWSKPNTTPTSVRDRLATKHEFIYVFSRQPRYFFDLDAVRQPHTTTGRPSSPRAVSRPQARPGWLGPNSDGDGGLQRMHAQGIVGHPLGKNPGDVWQIPVSTYRGAHFATYPEALVERMLLAGCPEARCRRCRAPFVRSVERTTRTAHRLPLQPTCDCESSSEPGLVLDPFLGSGTTAVVAERLGRDWLGIELNPAFVALAQQRLKGERARAGPRSRAA